jgi:hypothetical protein
MEGSKACILAVEQSAAALVAAIANRVVLIDVEVLIMEIYGESLGCLWSFEGHPHHLYVGTVRPRRRSFMRSTLCRY